MASAVWRSWTQSSNLTVACAHSKYRTKTLQEKRDILQEVDAALLSKQEIAKEHTIPKRTLSTYAKNKRSIEEALKGPCRHNTSLPYPKDPLFHSARSALTAASDAPFTENQNFNLN